MLPASVNRWKMLCVHLYWGIIKKQAPTEYAMPPEIRKGNAEEVEDFLIDGWLFSLFNEHNNTNNR